MTRALPNPSATRIRPSGVNATSCGWLKWVSSSPLTPGSPSVISSSLPSFEKTKIACPVSWTTQTRRSGS